MIVRFLLPSYTVVEDEGTGEVEVVLSNQPAMDIQVRIFASRWKESATIIIIIYRMELLVYRQCTAFS